MADTVANNKTDTNTAVTNIPGATGKRPPKSGGLILNEETGTYSFRPEKVSPLGQEGSSSWLLMKKPQFVGGNTDKKEKPLKTRGVSQQELLQKYRQQPGAASTPHTMPSACRLIPHIIMLEKMHDVQFIQVFDLRLGTSSKDKEKLRRDRNFVQRFLRWDWAEIVCELPSATLDRLNDALMSMTSADRDIWGKKFDKLADYLLSLNWKDGKLAGKPLDLPNKMLIIETADDEFPDEEVTSSEHSSSPSETANAPTNADDQATPTSERGQIAAD